MIDKEYKSLNLLCKEFVTHNFVRPFHDLQESRD